MRKLNEHMENILNILMNEKPAISFTTQWDSVTGETQTKEHDNLIMSLHEVETDKDWGENVVTYPIARDGHVLVIHQTSDTGDKSITVFAPVPEVAIYLMKLEMKKL